MASSSTRPEMASKGTSRLPPPSLFQGPPSRNASTLSLASIPGILDGGAPHDGEAAAGSSMNFLHPSAAGRSSRPRRPSTLIAQQSETDRADAMWIEMQNTLAEVELSAEYTTHVFRHEHSKALEELRTAQLALAQAWARSEGEDGSLGDMKRDDETAKDKEGTSKISDTGGSTTEQGVPDVPVGGPAKIGPANAAAAMMRDDPSAEEESRKDILMARKRREANDKYFQRVNEGVLEVVAKLEDVALAMRKVEKESRDIWSETESVASTDELSAE